MTIAGNVPAVVYYADDYVKKLGWTFGSRVIHPLLPFDTAEFSKVG